MAESPTPASAPTASATAARAGRPLLTVTPKALARAKALLARHAKPAGTGFRVGVRGGGCSGLTYAIDFESEARKGDHVLEAEDVRFYLDIKSQLFLAGTTLDYVETLMDRSFQFINPKAWMMTVTAVSLYVAAGPGYWVALAVVSATFLIVSIPSIAIWAGFGAGMKSALREPSRVKLFNRAMAVLTILSAGLVFLWS